MKMFERASELQMRFRVIVKKNDDAEAYCSICHENINAVGWCKMFYACKHAYHIRCLNEWFVRRLNCPLCRAPVFFNSRLS